MIFNSFLRQSPRHVPEGNHTYIVYDGIKICF